jgi:drug/metabolite transporter (DMT)-like permease
MPLVILLYLLFASVFTIGKTGLEYTQPFFFVGSRMLVAGILLLGYQFLFKRDQFFFDRKFFKNTLLLAIFNIYLTNVFEFWGLQYLTSFKTCFIYSLSPFISALLSYFIFKEILTGKKWAGLLIGFIGFFPILLTHTATELEVGELFFFSWPELAVMVASVCSVYGWILMRGLVQGGLSPLLANGSSMVIGGLISLIHSALVESWNPLPVTEPLPFIECAVLLILISNLAAYNLYGYLLKRYSATFVSFAGFTTPLFTALFGWYFLGETVTWAFYASTLIVFAGLYLFNQEELRGLEKSPLSIS